MVSLVVMGEYDEMKYLMRDGAKKLRDAVDLPDGALLAINRSRSQQFFSPLSPSRKRDSPYTLSSSPFISVPKSPKANHLLSTIPPKLKPNPRDNSVKQTKERGAHFNASHSLFKNSSIPHPPRLTSRKQLKLQIMSQQHELHDDA